MTADGDKVASSTGLEVRSTDSPEAQHATDLSTATATQDDQSSKCAIQGKPKKKFRNLYLHQCEYNTCPERWSQWPSVADEHETVDRKAEATPIIIRHRGNPGDWEPSQIEFNDEHVRRVLVKALDNYQDLDLETDSWIMKEPFMPLVHRWEELKTLEKTCDDAKLRDAAATLLEAAKPLVADNLAALERVKRDGMIKCTKAWLLFSPGTVSVGYMYEVRTIYRVVKYRRSRDEDQWVITVEYVEWDGQRCGYDELSVRLDDWTGFARVYDLALCPLYLDPGSEALEKAMLKRGKRFQELRGFHYAQCSGTKILLETEDKGDRRPVNAKVCIDAHAYYTTYNHVPLKLRSLNDDDDDDDDDDYSHVEADEGQEQKSEDNEEGKQDGEKDEDDEDTKTISSPPTPPPHISCSSKEKGAPTQHRPPQDLTPLAPADLLLATPWLKAFDMKSKSWCEVNIDEVISPVAYNDEAFDKLVLPGGEKELAWAFVENKTLLSSSPSSLASGGGGGGGDSGEEEGGEEEEPFDDFIQSKGLGLIILMFGPPGVGKTFTAEAVAERCRVPLYSMSAGDLGTRPSEVEENLERALTLCKMWNAMLLLDEADVFLGKRTGESLARNELVSIFLTKLEYYSGILFLTTNRVRSIDPAFQSRVDLFLPYRDLTPAARKEVWGNFMERTPGGRGRFDFGGGGSEEGQEGGEEAMMDKLAELKLNGREIKNLIKSAGLLSLNNKSGGADGEGKGKKGRGKVSVDMIYKLASKRVQTLSALEDTEDF